ncbi:formyltransferase family protein [Schleiferiaceae bacterium]|nr:formyltransferase family protein [Schleiferiaceae bacterium]
MSDLKIIFVAFSENTLGRQILWGIEEIGLKPVKAYMASKQAQKDYRKRSIKRYLKRNGYFNLIWRIIYRITVRRNVRSSSLKISEASQESISAFCQRRNIPLSFFDNINNADFIKKLAQDQPDLIVLGGAPLIKKAVIQVPKIAVLNSHPGVLPEAKGMDVVSQSILQEIPLGVTVFQVDEGMDTGPIILLEKLDSSIKGLKLHEIEAMIEQLSARAMVKAIEKIRSGDYNFVNQEGDGNIFTSLNYSTYRKVASKLRSNQWD